ncbi:MAG TPA: tRNA lysidine(34) synthetase TilS [Pyrinomonadaceae bacterium]|jgi:tRNA(Ile)-lysidine synthase|nr:tRNA lysidine(34) synthetase TilS [Pyrinomonadaceae bacterium]
MDTGRKEQSQSVVQARGRVSGRAGNRLSAFAGALLKEWKRLGLSVAEEGVVVAVSGGADSTALLLALDELLRTGRLGLRLRVAHLDHGLRGEAGEEDARWVLALAKELGVEVEVGRVDVKESAAGAGDNLEQAARRARYEFLAEMAEECGARVVLTGHTMDDQAETVLLRLLRGSGADGLGGIEAVRALVAKGEVQLARPLVGWARRVETERYCRERGVEFRVDAMNEDERFARVRVRRQLLPLLESFNPRVVEALSRTAELLREDASALNAAAEELLSLASEEEKDALSEKVASIPAPLSVDILGHASAAVRRRALRLWLARGRGDLRRLELVHLVGVEKLLTGERGGRVAELPGDCFVERRRGRLILKRGTRNAE